MPCEALYLTSATPTHSNTRPVFCGSEKRSTFIIFDPRNRGIRKRSNMCLRQGDRAIYRFFIDFWIFNAIIKQDNNLHNRLFSQREAASFSFFILSYTHDGGLYGTVKTQKQSYITIVHNSKSNASIHFRTLFK